MKKIITLFIFFLSLNAFSQDKVIVNGEEFYMHKVKKKETVYGISKQYDVSVEAINRANPEIINGLQKGQLVKVPVKTTPTSVKPTDSKNNYVVLKGETLYSIAKKHNVSVDDLVKANTEKATGIQPGDVLVIPSVVNATPVVSIPTSTPKASAFKHTVLQGETLYGISKKHNVSVEDLVTLNKEKATDLKPGDELIIPEATNTATPQKTTPDNLYLGKVIEYEVEEGETVYGIAKKHNVSVEEITKLNNDVIAAGIKKGDILKIKVATPLKMEVGKNPGNIDLTQIRRINPLKEKLEKMVLKESYNMTLLLPFMLDKNAALQASKMPNDPQRIYQLTEMSTHYYQGVKLALDTVKATGVSITLNVYDTKKDTAYLEKLFKTDELLNSDVILGPLYEETYSKTADFAKKNKIQLVCPVDQSNKTLFNNPYVSKLKVSLPTQAEYLGDFLARNYNTENVIIVTGKTKKDLYLAEVFTNEYNKKIANKKNNYKNTVTNFKFISYKDMSGMKDKLVADKKNVIVFPTTDLGLAASFFTQLNVEMNKTGMHKHEVMVFGLENYLGKEFENISIEHKVKYNLHVTSSEFIDYESEQVKAFITKYKAQFGTDPNDFAFMGYDAALYHAMALKSFGKSFSDKYDYLQIPLLQTNYKLKRTHAKSGFENQHVFILSLANYQLNRVE